MSYASFTQKQKQNFKKNCPAATPTTISTFLSIPESQSEVSDTENSHSQAFLNSTSGKRNCNFQGELHNINTTYPVYLPNVSSKTPPSTPPVNAVDPTVSTSVLGNLYLRPATSDNRDPDETPRPMKPVVRPTTGVDYNHNGIPSHPHTSFSKSLEAQPLGPPNPIMDGSSQQKDKDKEKTKAKAKAKARAKGKAKAKGNYPQLPHDVPEFGKNTEALKKGKARAEQPAIVGSDWVQSILFRANNLYQLQEILKDPGLNRTQFTTMYPYTDATPMGIRARSSSSSSRPLDGNSYDNTPDPRACSREQSEIGQENPSCDTRPRDMQSPGRTGKKAPLEHGNQAAPLFATEDSERSTSRLSSPSLLPQVDDVEMRSQDMQPHLTSLGENQPSTPEMRPEADDRLSPLRHTSYRQLSSTPSDRFMDVDSHNPRSSTSQLASDLESTCTGNGHQHQAEPHHHDHSSASKSHTYPPPVGEDSQPRQCSPNTRKMPSDAENGYEAGAEENNINDQDNEENWNNENYDDQGGYQDNARYNEQYEDHEEPDDPLEELNDNPQFVRISI